jgi:hypothetical protein
MHAQMSRDVEVSMPKTVAAAQPALRGCVVRAHRFHGHARHNCLGLRQPHVPVAVFPTLVSRQASYGLTRNLISRMIAIF